MGGQRKILVLNGDIDGNLGDHAILKSMSQALRMIDPNIEITAVSAESIRAEREYNARIVPRGMRGLLKLCTAAAHSDMVLCGGGGLFQDDDSLIKMPYWGLRVALMRLFCRQVIGYSLGIGPLNAPTSRFFARLAFACMARITARDPQAQHIAQALTRKEVGMLPDPALLIPPVSEETARGWLLNQGVPNDSRPLIGIAPRRWFPPRFRIIPHRMAVKLNRGKVRSSRESELLTELFAEVLDNLVHRHNAHILFLPTYNVPHEGDDRICKEILGKMTSSRGHLLYINDPALYKGVTAQLSVLLGGRMHPTIFAASVGTPVVGLAYNQKFQGFFELLGLRERVLDVEVFVRERRVKDLTKLIEAAMEDRAGLLVRVTSLAEQIQAFNRGLLEQAA